MTKDVYYKNHKRALTTTTNKHWRAKTKTRES